jgi:uncharacterized protein YdbL (DUF1318 family)
MLVSLPALAIDLNSARIKGVVGETKQGYIEPLGQPDEEVMDLVRKVNAQRRQAYKKISNGNGQPLNVVEKLAAQKIYDKVPSGTFLQKPGGGWARK